MNDACFESGERAKGSIGTLIEVVYIKCLERMFFEEAREEKRSNNR